MAFSLITASKREPDAHFMSPHTESDFDITQWSKTDQLSSILSLGMSISDFCNIAAPANHVYTKSTVIFSVLKIDKPK